jgi:FimV-like protein
MTMQTLTRVSSFAVLVSLSAITAITVRAQDEPAATPGNVEAIDAPATPPAPREYGPTKRGDTLAVVAKAVRGDLPVSTEQMAWALYEANPEAFDRGDINRLKLNVVLAVPAAETVMAVDHKTARAEILRRASAPAAEPDDPAVRELKTQLKETRDEAEETQKERELLKKRLIEMEKMVQELLRQNAERDAELRKQGVPTK